jgi:hypothetical protein
LARVTLLRKAGLFAWWCGVVSGLKRFFKGNRPKCGYAQQTNLSFTINSTIVSLCYPPRLCNGDDCLIVLAATETKMKP